MLLLRILIAAILALLPTGGLAVAMEAAGKPLGWFALLWYIGWAALILALLEDQARARN